MKVSDRIKEIRNVLDSSGVDRTVGAIRIAVSADLIQLEAEIAEALQAAKQEGYLNGYRDGYSGGYDDGEYYGSDNAYDR